MKKAPSPHWDTLYDTAARFRDLAPWQWLYDSDLFGIRHPDTGEIGWCSIMGNAGKHYAMAVYRGAEGLESFYALAESGERKEPNNPELFNAMLSQNCLMISFEDANMVPPDQKAHLKALGKSFRGAGQWIVVQSFDPGLSPWLVQENDLPWLVLCLEQAIDVARRAKDDPALLERDEWLVRTPDASGGWSDVFLAEDDLPLVAEMEPIAPSKAFLDKVKFLPELEGAVALVNVLFPKPIQESKSERPWHPVLLLGVAPGSGYIVAQDMAAYHDLPTHLEPFLLTLLKAVGARPSQLLVHHEPMAIWMSDIADAAGMEMVLLSGDEPFVTEPLEAMLGMV